MKSLLGLKSQILIIFENLAHFAKMLKTCRIKIWVVYFNKSLHTNTISRRKNKNK